MTDTPRRTGRRLSPRTRQTLAMGTLATSVTLAGCGEPAPDFERFTSVSDCAASGFSRLVCEEEFDRAAAAHLQTAPRFDDLSACEAEFGDGRCNELPQIAEAGTDGEAATDEAQPRGSFFAPFLTGYLVSSALSRVSTARGYAGYYANNPSYRPAPVYRTRAGQDVTTAREGNRTVTRPVNRNTRTVARRGFGGSGFARGGGRGFGG